MENHFWFASVFLCLWKKANIMAVTSQQRDDFHSNYVNNQNSYGQINFVRDASEWKKIIHFHMTKIYHDAWRVTGFCELFSFNKKLNIISVDWFWFLCGPG